MPRPLCPHPAPACAGHDRLCAPTCPGQRRESRHCRRTARIANESHLNLHIACLYPPRSGSDRCRGAGAGSPDAGGHISPCARRRELFSAGYLGARLLRFPGPPTRVQDQHRTPKSLVPTGPSDLAGTHCLLCPTPKSGGVPSRGDSINLDHPA